MHGLEWWQIDITGMVIRGMRKVRMVRNVRVPTAKQLAMKAATTPQD
jgi:fatty-acid desaturase